MTDLTEQSWISALLKPEAFTHEVDQLELIETHISWVVLTGKYAYKIKKPIDLGFLDFSTLEKRHECALAEVALNRPLAPDVYLGVVAISGDAAHPRVAGDGPVFEYAVKMHQFAQSAQLDRMLERGELQPEQIDAFATRIADFHQQADVVADTDPYGSAAAVWEPVAENFQHIRASQVPDMDTGVLDELERWARSVWQSLQTTFADRKAQGFVRQCHGDLHLRNLAWIEGEAVAFDCIEFNRNLSCIDVLCDVAFLVMDLQDRAQHSLANRFLNRYLETTGDYESLDVLPYYLAYRALVRAKVTAIRFGQPDLPDPDAVRREFEEYLRLARSYGHGDRPVLILTCGLSGSGKTTVTTPLLEHLGAIRLRSDVERKRLFGLRADESGRAAPGKGIYDAEAHERTYERLLALARSLISAGRSVIVDATFLERKRREPFRALAGELAAGFVLLQTTAPADELRRRIAGRQADASDADLSVLEAQLASLGSQPLVSAAEQDELIVVDTTAEIDYSSLVQEIASAATRSGD